MDDEPLWTKSFSCRQYWSHATLSRWQARYTYAETQHSIPSTESTCSDTKELSSKEQLEAPAKHARDTAALLPRVLIGHDDCWRQELADSLAETPWESCLEDSADDVWQSQPESHSPADADLCPQFGTHDDSSKWQPQAASAPAVSHEDINDILRKLPLLFFGDTPRRPSLRTESRYGFARDHCGTHTQAAGYVCNEPPKYHSGQNKLLPMVMMREETRERLTSSDTPSAASCTSNSSLQSTSMVRIRNLRPCARLPAAIEQQLAFSSNIKY